MKSDRILRWTAFGASFLALACVGCGTVLDLDSFHALAEDGSDADAADDVGASSPAADDAGGSPAPAPGGDGDSVDAGGRGMPAPVGADGGGRPPPGGSGDGGAKDAAGAGDATSAPRMDGAIDPGAPSGMAMEAGSADRAMDDATGGAGEGGPLGGSVGTPPVVVAMADAGLTSAAPDAAGAGAIDAGGLPACPAGLLDKRTACTETDPTCVKGCGPITADGFLGTKACACNTRTSVFNCVDCVYPAPLPSCYAPPAVSIACGAEAVDGMPCDSPCGGVCTVPGSAKPQACVCVSTSATTAVWSCATSWF